MELGLPVTQEQVDELKAHAEDINYEVAEERERLVRHDVMSHVYAYGQQCPKAAGIIHLGATSCYVGDNTDIIIMTEAMKIVRKKLVNVIRILSHFAEEYKDLPTLAFTHFQPAQPTTVGKRATLWMQEFLMDLEDVEYQLKMCIRDSESPALFNERFLDQAADDARAIHAAHLLHKRFRDRLIICDDRQHLHGLSLIHI